MTLCNARRLTTNVSGGNLTIEEEERVSGSGAEATYGIIGGIRNCITKDNVK